MQSRSDRRGKGTPNKSGFVLGLAIALGALALDSFHESQAVQASLADREAGARLAARLACDNKSGLCYFHGDTFRLGTLTLGDLKSYCAHLTVTSWGWRLPTSQELQPALSFLAHGTGAWSDFSYIDLKGPGYLIFTASEQDGMAYSADRRIFNVYTYRLYGNAGYPALSKLGLSGTVIIGPSVDTAPLMDGSGNVSLVKVVCVANKQ